MVISHSSAALNFTPANLFYYFTLCETHTSKVLPSLQNKTLVSNDYIPSF